MALKRVLITGMSGTGKSTVIRALADLGHAAHDLDTPEWSEWVEADPSDDLTPEAGKDWVWREDRVRDLLSQPLATPLFVSGAASNMGRLYPLIDTIILLSAPLDTIMARLEARSEGAYGSRAEDRDKVARLIETVEPLLRASAHHEIDTRQPLPRTLAVVLNAAGWSES